LLILIFAVVVDGGALGPASLMFILNLAKN